jgi:hypothetical protein
MGQDAAERTSLNQRRSSCFARSASLSSPPPLSAPPLSLRPRHRLGDAAADSAGSMADFTRDGAIGVSAMATAVGRAGVISILTVASGLSDRRQYRDDARPPRRGRVSPFTGRPAERNARPVHCAGRRLETFTDQARVAELSSTRLTSGHGRLPHISAMSAGICVISVEGCFRGYHWNRRRRTIGGRDAGRLGKATLHSRHRVIGRRRLAAALQPQLCQFAIGLFEAFCLRNQVLASCGFVCQDVTPRASILPAAIAPEHGLQPLDLKCFELHGPSQ